MTPCPPSQFEIGSESEKFQSEHMNKKEKDILKKAVDSNEGQISPATMINSYAEGDQGIVERLVGSGYLERVYQFREGLHQATYSIIFYAVTEKGLMQFSTFPKKLWFNFRNQTAVYVGLLSVIISLAAFFSTLVFSYVQNNRENIDFQLRNRPYLVINKTESSNIVYGKSADFGLHLKNIGILPARVVNVAAHCPPDADFPPREEKIIIGNGEEMIFNFSIPSELGSARCRFSVNYVMPMDSSTKDIFNTEYIFKFKNDSTVVYESSFIR